MVKPKAHSSLNSATRPSTLEIWLTAARPHTLTASLSPCLVAYGTCRPPTHLFAAWVLFCLTVQLGTNLHNDYADFVKGADTKDRVGHARATARGWLTPTQTCIAATSALSVTLASGIYLVNAVNQWHNPFLWFLIFSSIFNAFAYTGGPYPLGYIGLADWSIAYVGLGDVFVFLYFGLVATLMLPYLMLLQQSDGNFIPAAERTINWSKQLIYSTQVGLLATNIIVGRSDDNAAGLRICAGLALMHEFRFFVYSQQLEGPAHRCLCWKTNISSQVRSQLLLVAVCLEQSCRILSYNICFFQRGL